MSLAVPATVDAVAGPHRGWLLASLGVLLLGLGLLAFFAVPWGALPREVAASADPRLDFTDAQIAAAEALRDPLRVLGLLSGVVGLATALVLGLTPWGARLIDALPGGTAGRLLLGVPLLLAIGRLLTLPLAVRSEQLLRDAGLSTRSWSGFAVDLTKGWLLQAVIVTGAVAAVVLLARRLPSAWPWVVAVGAAVLVVVLSLLYPLVVEPVFNRFTPLPDGPQRDRLLALAEDAGVRVGDVLVVDASRRTAAHNAYVSGFGPTARLVVYDTLLQDVPADQVEVVVAHELGHAARGDVLVGTALGALGAAAAALLVGLALTWPALVQRSGATGPGDPAIAALLLAVLAVVGVVATPGSNAISRQVEARADRFALDLTGDAATVARMQRDLALANLADPDPPAWAHRWWGTHPTTAERLALARAWAGDHGQRIPPLAAP